jgi:carbon-monoxide dehydrogenase large subunit
VRFVGDPIACVVAETLAQAKDASEAIEVDIEPLPVVTTPDQAVAKARRAVRGRAGQRRARFPLRRQREGQRRVRRAAHKVKLKLINTGCRQRDRAARRDRQLRQGKERYTLHSVSQGVMG